MDARAQLSGGTMSRIRSHRRIATSVTASAIVALACGVWLVQMRLGHASMLTGWTLLICLAGLVALGIRKKLVMLPLLPVAVWVRVHTYLGLFASAAYLLHVPRVIGGGILEAGLSVAFLGTASSGLLGVYLNRTAPRRLRAVPGEYRFDRIGWHRRQIAEHAQRLVGELSGAADRPVLARFYDSRLATYFAGPPSTAYLLLPTGHRRRRLLAELGELHRYLSSDLRTVAGHLAALVRSRDSLDYHYALQLRLRLWLVAHLMLTAILLVLVGAHLFLVLQFQGG